MKAGDPVEVSEAMDTAAPNTASAAIETPRPISVVIPSFHSSATIVRAVQSALRQNRGIVCVIVIIDDSCADTVSELAALADGRVLTIVNPKNIGAPASRNRGLGLVTTPYVAFLDADDYFEGDLLGPLVAKMQKEGAQLGFGPSLHWSPAIGFTHYYVPDYRDHADVFIRWFGGSANVNTGSVAWAADYLRQIGAWDECIQRNQDGELAMRAILLGANFTMSEKGASVWYNDQTVQRITTRTDNLRSLFDVVEKFQKMPSRFVADAVRLEACALHLHLIAHTAYCAGADEVGCEALARRRSLGIPPPKGALKHRLSVALRFIPRKQRSRMWRLGKSLLKSCVSRLPSSGSKTLRQRH